MLEAPAVAEHEAASEEQGEATDSAPHRGAAPDPACWQRSRAHVRGQAPGPRPQGTQGTWSAQAKELLREAFTYSCTIQMCFKQMKKQNPEDLNFKQFQLVTLVLGNLVKFHGEEMNTSGLAAEPSSLGDHECPQEVGRY